MENIIEKIKEADNIAVFVHENPDGDAIGSIIALTYGLEKMGKKAEGFIEFVPANYSFLLDKTPLIKTYDEMNTEDKYNLCISLDCGAVERMGAAKDVFNNAEFTINIDHHYTNTLFGNINYVDGKASSTGEIMFDLINGLNITMDKKIAEAVYTSIISDTGMFRYQNTTKKTFEIAGKLVETGIDISEITRKAFYETSIDRTKCLAKVLESLTMYLDGKVGIMEISDEEVKKYEIDEQDLEGMVDFSRNICGAEVGIFIKPKGGEYKVSLRSNGKVNVAELAAKFGGGGHVCASGCRFPDKSISEIKKKLIKELELIF